MQERSYSGEDRRGAAHLHEASPFGAPYAAALTSCLILAAAVLVAGSVRDIDLTPALPAAGLLGATAAVLSVAAGLCVLCWRLAGFAPALWIGAGLAVTGPMGIVLDGLLPEGSPDLVRSAAPVAGIAALTCFGYATVQASVDARLRPLWVLGGALFGSIVVSFAVDTVDDRLGADLAISVKGLWPALCFAGGWLALAAVCTDRSRRPGGRWLFAWLGVMAVAFSLDALVVAFSSLTARPVPVGHEGLLLAGALCGLWGAGRELHMSFVAQRVQLLSTKVSAEAADVKARRAAAEAEDRAHEARNALLAIEGATRTLERHHDTLPPDVRAGLADAVSAEIGRLQRLVTGDGAVRRPAPFGVAEALAPAVTGARAQGVDVVVDIPGSLHAYGTWSGLVEVVQNLLENARRHAPGSTVWLSAADVDGRVQVRVSDAGSGVPLAERVSIFERGVRGAGSVDVPGSGLGLHISKRLMVDQLGDLWVEGTPGCGAEFVAEMPAASVELTGPGAARSAEPAGGTSPT